MTQPEPLRYVIPSAAGPLGLGRHVNHDPRSRRYPFRSTPAALGEIFHERHIPIFDQGQLGSCTGNAGLGILATGPYWGNFDSARQQNGPAPRYPWAEAGAVQLYSDVTADDGFAGQYPPDDTGSDGLSVGKELVKRGVIPGYQHTFSLNAALAALQRFPLLVGTVWTEAMFDPDALGRIKPSGSVAGGHEWIVDEYVPAGGGGHAGSVLSTTYAYVGGTTSWGTSFGIDGRFYLSTADFGRLLSDNGDVIILTPPTAPAPQPEPQPQPPTSADATLAAAMRTWLAAHPEL